MNLQKFKKIQDLGMFTKSKRVQNLQKFMHFIFLAIT